MNIITNADELSPDDVIYLNNLVCACVKLTKERRGVTDTDENAMIIVNTIKDFYRSDWVGILHVDVNINIFRVCWWNSTRSGPYGETLYDAYAGTEMFGHWQETLMKHENVIIEDIESLASDDHDEYHFLKENHVHSILAYPIYGEETGCILVRNPERYLHRVEMLDLVKPSLEELLGKKKAIGITHPSTSENKEEHNLLVRFFGKPEMKIYGNILEIDQIPDGPAAWEVLYYLNEHKNRAFTAQELAYETLIHPHKTNADSDRLRKKLYKLQASFEAAYGEKQNLFKDDSIPKNKPCYKFNCGIGLQFDYELFDAYIRKYHEANNDFDRLEYLQQAMELYRGDLFNGDPFKYIYMQKVDEYHRIFLCYLDKYMELLLKTGCYEKASSFSWRALEIEPGYYFLYATAYVALVKQHFLARAENTITRALKELTRDAYNEMLELIGQYLPDADIEELRLYNNVCPDEDMMGNEVSGQ